MNRQELLEYLTSFGIKHETFDHEPIFTVAEGIEKKIKVPGAHTKNLFLKDDKKQFWLISALRDTKINLRALSKVISAKNLRFAQPELLREHLGVGPGSVTWFALVNNPKNTVKAILDKKIFEHDRVGFHPLENNATTVVAPGDLLTFVDSLGHEYKIFDFSSLI